GALLPRDGPALDRLHLLRPGHLHVAPEGEPRVHVLQLTATDAGELTARSVGSAPHLHVHELLRHGLARLVDGDQHAEADDGRKYGDQHPCSRILRAMTRASRSAARTVSSESAGAGSCRSSTRSISSAIPGNGKSPARNAATATSFAALKTAGATPPHRPASTPS